MMTVMICTPKQLLSVWRNQVGRDRQVMWHGGPGSCPGHSVSD